MKEPGTDYPWAIGTELRQQRMHDPPVSTPKNFRNVLIDDLKRRYYLLDADVLEHTLALASIEPTPNNQGFNFSLIMLSRTISLIFFLFQVKLLPKIGEG